MTKKLKYNIAGMNDAIPPPYNRDPSKIVMFIEDGKSYISLNGLWVCLPDAELNKLKKKLDQAHQIKRQVEKNYGTE